MVGYRKYSEAWYNHAVKRLDEIKELLRQPETDMFERYKLYSEELKLLEGVYDYELVRGVVFDCFNTPNKNIELLKIDWL